MLAAFHISFRWSVWSTRMNVTADLHSAGQADALLARLESWYCAHSSIRRLRVIERSGELEVAIRLEPTSDGDDDLPVWLANIDAWMGELMSLTRRQVRLHLLTADAPKNHLPDDGALLAELGWRDIWT